MKWGETESGCSTQCNKLKQHAREKIEQGRKKAKELQGVVKFYSASEIVSPLSAWCSKIGGKIAVLSVVIQSRKSAWGALWSK